MLKLLIPVDDSPSSLRLAEHLYARLAWYKPPVEVHLLTVRPALHGDVGMFIDSEQIRQFHQEEGLKVLAPIRERLDADSIPYQIHIGVGDPAEVIVQYAREKDCDEIVMGASGRSPFAAFFTGSVPARVLHIADLPVSLIK
ncbi:Nucleotide-binding universal stress protein, UspA family [Methylomagnum ishizawai]|uniref:Nucleotide-binding universal stress protein, UspA family n=1 Tax=Methylomagnum ishizawai TaxID=1760988 RepID=A0A1Y6D0P7_9GAMM|nr:universal stress protein [Methylomagnum ishizawai]SMF96498.1 Nucleotide-binding universal stress protein, UspA family [Methylomagnum ishizawai]